MVCCTHSVVFSRETSARRLRWMGQLPLAFADPDTHVVSAPHNSNFLCQDDVFAVGDRVIYTPERGGKVRGTICLVFPNGDFCVESERLDGINNYSAKASRLTHDNGAPPVLLLLW